MLTVGLLALPQWLADQASGMSVDGPGPGAQPGPGPGAQPRRGARPGPNPLRSAETFIPAGRRAPETPPLLSVQTATPPSVRGAEQTMTAARHAVATALLHYCQRPRSSAISRSRTAGSSAHLTNARTTSARGSLIASISSAASAVHRLSRRYNSGDRSTVMRTSFDRNAVSPAGAASGSVRR